MSSWSVALLVPLLVLVPQAGVYEFGELGATVLTFRGAPGNANPGNYAPIVTSAALETQSTTIDAMSLSIRPATQSDVPLILEFIRALANYEKLAHQVVATEAKLEQTLFGERVFGEVVIAEFEGKPAGFALFFTNYSTFLAQPGLYLEDLFVAPAFRGKGIGRALLVYLATVAAERDCGRFEWSVLDWNEPAIGFYKSLGARPVEGFDIYRVDGDALTALATL